jgi:hypothetical protein
MMIFYQLVRPRYALVLAVGLAAGCSGGDDLPREPVSGTVTLDKQPLANGVIQFTPAEKGATGATPAGGQITGGKFYISRDQGPVPGKYNVSINSASKSERTKPAQVGGGKMAELAKELIPARYNSSTELHADVEKGGSNTFTFTLESK